MGGGVNVRDVRGCICSVLDLKFKSASFFTPTQPVYKSKLQMFTNILGKCSSNCTFSMKNTSCFSYVIYVLKTIDFVNGFPGRMYRIIWNILFKNHSTTDLFPVPLET